MAAAVSSSAASRARPAARRFAAASAAFARGFQRLRGGGGGAPGPSLGGAGAFQRRARRAQGVDGARGAGFRRLAARGEGRRLGLKARQAAALREPGGRAALGLRRGDEPVPPPQVALAAHQALALRQRSL